MTKKKGYVCESNDMLICLGWYTHVKNRRRKRKTTESRKVVMQNIRTLAGIHIKFREIGHSKNMPELKLRDLFCRGNFNLLEQALDELLLDDEKINLEQKL